jgi:hypothetical protein
MEADLQACETAGKGKKVSQASIRQRKQQVMDRWIPPDPKAPVKGRYKDPAVGTFSKVVNSDR